MSGSKLFRWTNPAARGAYEGRYSKQESVSLNKSFWKSRNLFSKRFLVAEGKKVKNEDR